MTLRQLLASIYGVHVVQDMYLHDKSPGCSPQLHMWQHEHELMFLDEDDSWGRHDDSEDRTEHRPKQRTGLRHAINPRPYGTSRGQSRREKSLNGIR